LIYTVNSSAASVATAGLSISTLTVAPVAAGTATITITANDGRGGAVSTSFGVTVQGNQAPVIAHTPPASPPPAGQDILIQANVADESGVSSVTLHYRRGGDAGSTMVVMTPGGNTYQAIIPASAAISRGVVYFITATDAANLTARLPASGVFSMRIRMNSESKPTEQPAGSAQTSYHLISIPFDLDDKSPAAVLEDELGPYDNTKWRLFGLSNGQYVEHPNAGTFSPGQSLFLIVKDPNKIIDVGAGSSVRLDQEFSIDLALGHNFIASPFNFNIPASKLRLASGGTFILRNYSSSWVAASGFSPWEGYHIANNRPTSDVLLVNPDLSSALTLATVRASGESGWRVQIRASCDQARDTENFAGIAITSADGWDENDCVEPPPIGEYVSLYFPHPEWQKVLARYSDDMRAASNSNQRWRFAVETNIVNEMVTLRFEGVKAIDHNLAVFLVDEALNYKQNLRENAVYQYQPRRREQLKEFTLIVGKEDFISEQTSNVPGAPEDFVLEQNFPNPFPPPGRGIFDNPETAIRFGLPQQSVVTIRIFDLAGHEIATVLDRIELPAGRHQRVWDGRDAQGRIVVSGIYFYRLIAGSFSKTMKLMLVR